MFQRTLLLCAFFLAVVRAGSAAATILPPNNLYLEDVPGKRSNITQAQFEELISRATTIFTPIVESLGGTLIIRGAWDDSTVNASAMQRWGSWIVNMYGGLARRDEIDLDGFTLVLCHEIGHHLAGYPFASSWSSGEGEADYFSTMHCPKLMWGDDDQRNATSAETVAEAARIKCNDAWADDGARQRCYRTMNAAKSLANLMASLKNETVDFSAHDPREVEVTFAGHPAAQCRFDTYTAGALCEADYDPAVVPGKRDGRGYNDAEAEKEAGRYSCLVSQGHEIGMRPRCWFKSVIGE